jgi:excisionase family DNA binding protein
MREGDELLTIKQAADLLDVTPMTVRRHLKAGDIKYERPGREYLIWQSELERYAREKRGPGRPPRPAPPAR